MPHSPANDPTFDDDAAGVRALTDYYKANLLHALKYLGTPDSKEQYEIWKDHFSLSAITKHGIPKRLLDHGELTRAKFDDFTDCLWREKRLPDWLKSMLDTASINPRGLGFGALISLGWRAVWIAIKPKLVSSERTLVKRKTHVPSMSNVRIDRSSNFGNGMQFTASSHFSRRPIPAECSTRRQAIAGRVRHS